MEESNDGKDFKYMKLIAKLLVNYPDEIRDDEENINFYDAWRKAIDAKKFADAYSDLAEAVIERAAKEDGN